MAIRVVRIGLQRFAERPFSFRVSLLAGQEQTMIEMAFRVIRSEANCRLEMFLCLGDLRKPPVEEDEMDVGLLEFGIDGQCPLVLASRLRYLPPLCQRLCLTKLVHGGSV